MYSSSPFFTAALDGGEWSASRPGRILAPGKGPLIPILQEAGWAREPIWTQEDRGKTLIPLLGIETRSPVVRHYTDRNNPAPIFGDITLN
jgi:hypothetical protein